jgi:hypothetical protein
MGEAAKGILHIKCIDWAAVRLDYESEAASRPANACASCWACWRRV